MNARTHLHSVPLSDTQIHIPDSSVCTNFRRKRSSFGNEISLVDSEAFYGLWLICPLGGRSTIFVNLTSCSEPLSGTGLAFFLIPFCMS